MKQVMVLFVLSLLLVGSACGKQIGVTPAGGFSGIQAAVDAADPNDEIVLAPGVYTSESLVSIRITAKPLTLRSQDPNDPEIVAATILQCPSDGNESVPALVWSGGYEEYSLHLAGLTLTGGLTQPVLYAESGGDVTMASCIVRDNLSGGLEFGSIYSARLTDCLFTSNTALHGGAIYCEDAELFLIRCVFRGNRAEGQGGAVYGYSLECDQCQWLGNQAESGGAIYVTWVVGDNCVWSGNTAQVGGALYVDDVDLKRCTLVGNVASSSGGSAQVGGGSLSLENSIVVYNKDASGIGHSIMPLMGWERRGRFSSIEVSYCCLQLDPGEESNPFADSEGIIIADPCFVRLPDDGGDGWGDDPETPDVDEGLNDDYGDLRLAADSPCIDAGTWAGFMPAMTFDLNGLARVMGASIDMGAHEFIQPTLKVTRPQGDERWAAGSVQTLNWTQIGSDVAVDLLLSDDGGAQWQTLATEIDNTGSYTWQIPNDLNVNEALLRVTPSLTLEHQYIVDSAAFDVAPMTAGCPTNSPWPTLAGNVQRTGLGELTGPIGLQAAWDVNIPGEVFTSVTLGCNDCIHLVSNAGVLYTFDNQGQMLWSVDVNVPLLTTPTVGPLGRLYVGDNNGRLYAFDAQGTLQWTWETEGFICASVAVAADGRIYLASSDGTLMALSENGSQRWSFTLPSDNPLGDAALASPSIGPDGTLYVSGYFDATVYALDPKDGSLQWTCVCADANQPYRSQRGQTYVAPVVSDSNVIYQGLVNDSTLYAIDAPSGAVLWTLDCSASLSDTNEISVSNSVWSEPALGPDGTLYVAMDDPYLRAVSAHGTLQWTVTLGQTGGFTLAVGPDGLIYAAADDGMIYVVNTEGQIVTELAGGGSLCYPVVTSDGLLLATDVEHGLRAFSDSL